MGSFYIAVFPLFAKLIIKDNYVPEGHIDFLISHFGIDTINWQLGLVSYNSGVIMLVISNRPHTTCSAYLKLLAQLLPELYDTKSTYPYISPHIQCVLEK